MARRVSLSSEIGASVLQKVKKKCLKCVATGSSKGKANSPAPAGGSYALSDGVPKSNRNRGYKGKRKELRGKKNLKEKTTKKKK